MSNKTGIEWTDATWNPIRGCSRVSDGCRNCYAESVANRFSGDGQPYEGLIAKGGQWNGQIMLVDHKIDEPCRMTRPRMIFVNSMSDLFHPNISFEVVAGIFGIMAAASWHTFQVLTKRPERMREFFQWIDDHPLRSMFDCQKLQEQHPGSDWRPFFLADMASKILPSGGEGLKVELKPEWPLQNVWLGISVEDQATANERIPLLLQVPAEVRWLSCEPLLGPIGIDTLLGKMPEDDDGAPYPGNIGWVVVGGESGSNARPMHPEWATSLRNQCADAGVPFLFKQWGEWLPVGKNPHDLDTAIIQRGQTNTRCYAWGDGEAAIRVGKKATGRLLEGKLHDAYPITANTSR
ncbi:phage Gp37/Gp68 family protein [Halomonas janggokensis]|uniref:Phage Gp37/Gp68 family protein n=1 Tax=Vreelandella janggokensis TaxID=370767 RepID=A0ABT4IS60_9GAMM|nr:phage Gp37/Gp68 family protein [Halomonas janggokensis]MCZ0926504.1 phage Gp37/Gp68 family protein [Halomonas janggokensis]MCZ0929042.1 phage Gp37/Gp68 family protein [Halomonas janggokensis]